MPPPKKKDRRQRWRESHPWVRFVEWARRRCACTDPEKWYPNYGAKGIICDLVGKDLELVWILSGAANMKRPSLDRIHEDGNYTVGNVRFIEFNDNSKRAWARGGQFHG